MDSAGGAEAPKAPPLNPPLVKLNNWIMKESLAFHMRAGNTLAIVRKCAGSPQSPEHWLSVV